MRRKKKRLHMSQSESSVELNVMPFIDVFSLLCTFLLFSAVFVKIGLIEVQIPYLSSAVPSKEQQIKEEKRGLTLEVAIQSTTVEIRSRFTKAPINQKVQEYSRTKDGLQSFHKALVKLKEEMPSANKVTLFVEDNITYDKLVEVLDQIRKIYLGDSLFNNTNQDLKTHNLFPKIVMADVILM